MAANLDVQARYFPHTQDQLKEIASDILRHAKALGATDAATEISEGDGLSVSVRRGEVETIEHNRDKMVGVTVFIGKKRGNASTSDFSPAAIRTRSPPRTTSRASRPRTMRPASPKPSCSRPTRAISISITRGR